MCEQLRSATLQRCRWRSAGRVHRRGHWGSVVAGVCAIGGSVVGPVGTFFGAAVGTGAGAAVGGAAGTVLGFAGGFIAP